MDFYYIPLSPPCRSVMLTAKAVGVQLNLKHTNIMAGDHMKPEFLAINPQHSVPTLVDGDLKLWESRAICQYLAQQYGKDDSLYPKDPKKRARVDSYLYFDMGTLYHRWAEYAYGVLFRGQEKTDPKKLESFQEALGWLDGWLAGKQYAIGDQVTIADHSLIGTLSSIEPAGDYLSKHKNIVSWLQRCKKLPGYEEANAPGAKEFGEMAKKGLSK